jgi:hypothetical protein
MVGTLSLGFFAERVKSDSVDPLSAVLTHHVLLGTQHRKKKLLDG